MSSVGLVLGGGGVTGASYQMATLMALELATGWDPHRADAVVGTSGGSFVTAILRCGRLNLDSLVQHHEDRDAVAQRIAGHLFQRKPGVKVRSWVRHGLLPGLRRPGLTMLLGSPAPYEASGIAQWVRAQCEHGADRWPEQPTVITAFDVKARRRVAFGTDGAPDVGLADAVAASSAIPLVFRPWEIDGRTFVDGGVMSGTHADLLLGHTRPLDLVIVIAPMAAEQDREGAWAHERMFDRVGRSALRTELAMVRTAWPDADILTLTPSPRVLGAMRPNYMDPKAAVPTFIRALIAMKRKLAAPGVWDILDRHLVHRVGA
ncbi:MAG TPA: patatin-like phospholipase family protein [Acidimicrobiia bacterium]